MKNSFVFVCDGDYGTCLFSVAGFSSKEMPIPRFRFFMRNNSLETKIKIKSLMESFFEAGGIFSSKIFRFC